MKKRLLFLFFAFLFFISQGQIININASADTQSSFNPQKLIEEVLITGECTTVNSFSFQVKGSPTETETKSYGYFKKPSGSTFPFDEGIVLTTGRAFPAGNTKSGTILNNENGLGGDTDLQTALSNTGTADATYIKFNFVPLVETISFRFLMASEEYDGLLECDFADSFAFLLREVGTTKYINLAVLPDKTPVSVKNINRSSLINNPAGSRNCDANTAYFAGYNLTGTNYGGRTKVLTATATVVPSKTYEIKLVVADQGDSQYDSAIFLEAGSFNLGGDLGDDLTIATGKPGCKGNSVVLNATIKVSGVTYKWFKNTIEIPGQTNKTLNATTDGIYKVEIAFGGCTSTDEVVVEFTTPPVITVPPKNIVLCETDTNSIEVFNFSANAALVLGTQTAASFPISFHKSESDAQINKNPIAKPNAYTNTLQSETIWIRIADTTQTCFKVISFKIAVFKQPVANKPMPYQLCDDLSDTNDTNGITTFNLSTKINDVLKGQLTSNFDVKFYLTQAAANTGASGTEIIVPIKNTINPQPVYVRIENRLSTTCYATTTFNLVVNPKPVVKSVVELKQCDDDTDGKSFFNLTEANTLISTNYKNEIFTYYETDAQAKSGLVADRITNYTNYKNELAPKNLVYARIETVNGCYRITRINLVVGVSQIPASFKTLTYFVCDDKLVDNNNTNGIASFDFSDAKKKIKNLFPPSVKSTVKFYNNEADALAEINTISNISNHRNVGYPKTQNIYVRIDSDDVNACLGLGHHVTLTVNPLPKNNVIAPYVLCSDTDKITFNLTTKEPEIKGAQAVLVSYHVTEEDAINNVLIKDFTAYENKTNPQIIYVRSQFDTNGNGVADAGECFNTDMRFNLVVNRKPIIVQPDLIPICSAQIKTVFDLTVRKIQITKGDATIKLSYFESEADFNNSKPITTPKTYTNTQLEKNIIVLATGTNGCTSKISLKLKTILYANLNKTPKAIEECEIDNNGFDFFDLRRREKEILNGLKASDFYLFTYYEKEEDAKTGNEKKISNPSNFENTTKNTQTIYVRVIPKENECFVIIPLKLVVNQSPEIGIEKRYVICLNNKNKVVKAENTPFLDIPPIDTQLSASEYTFQWYKGTETEVNTKPKNFIITGATDSKYIPTTIGNYTVIATNKKTECTIPASTEVVGSYPPESISVKLVSTAFSGNNMLEVIVIGIGKYEFKLDNGAWQDSNKFERVRGGEHTIYVRDTFNCNEISKMQIVIDYPKYFTPNGDGNHDNWNIIGIATQPNSEIYIFDRYGKLLKQLSPREIGWDGNFNGKKLPTGDYWFIVKYNEPLDKTQREFRSHFTLKR